MYQGGILVDARRNEEAIADAGRILEQRDVVAFEPAIDREAFFVRVDVLVRTDTTAELIEVQARFCDPDDPGFWGKRDPGIRVRNRARGQLRALRRESAG